MCPKEQAPLPPEELAISVICSRSSAQSLPVSTRLPPLKTVTGRAGPAQDLAGPLRVDGTVTPSWCGR